MKLKTFLSFLLLLMPMSYGMAAIQDSDKYSSTIVVAADGSGDYATIGEALKKLKGDSEDPVRIYVKNGVYNEKILINYTINNLTLEGESREGTIISNGDYASLNNMGTSGSYTLRVDGNNVTVKNLTIENTAGRVGQAVALHTTGDKIHVKNCSITGNQDTLYASGRNARNLYEDCYIDGTVDFIFGAATALFRNCHIHAKGNGYLTAASTAVDNPVGYVFHKCKVTAAEEAVKVHLGRTWRPYASTFFIECELPEAIVPEGWHNWGKVENESTARYGEYKCTGPGAKEDKRVGWRKTLSDMEAASMTDPAIIFRSVSSWMPE
ncbi:MAG: pectinesterase family protein [Muribaculum sp.]|nr:pectinesterase family protein [Muribaculum sp.]